MTKRAAKKVATRKLAVETARMLWSAPGSYERNGMREIAAAMGMSTGAIFANFDSKADLWRAAMAYEPPVDCDIVRDALRAYGLRDTQGVSSAPAVSTAAGSAQAGAAPSPSGGAGRDGRE